MVLEHGTISCDGWQCCAIVREMKDKPKSRSISAVLHKDPRGRRCPVGYDRAAPLNPKDRELHAKLVAEGKPMSGRMGAFVYSYYNGRLHWHRYVVPKDPRTPAQRRSRAAFGKASKAWSENQRLTQEQRDDWYAAAAKIKSKPRLGLSGSLTAQQHFVRSNALKQRWGLSLLLEPPAGERKNAERSPLSAVVSTIPSESSAVVLSRAGAAAEDALRRTGMQNTTLSAQVQQPQRLVQTHMGASPGSHRQSAVPPPCSPRLSRGANSLSSPHSTPKLPATYATLLGPPPYPHHPPAGATPVAGGVSRLRRQHWFAPIVVHSRPNPPKRSPPRALARRLAMEGEQGRSS